MTYKINIVIEEDEHGFYAHAPDLEGCQTQGDTLDEVMENMREAVTLYLETLEPDERRTVLSKTILTTALEIEVA